MQVSPTSIQDQSILKAAVADRGKRAEAKPKTSPEAKPAEASPASEAQKEPGVIRLLEEGHFKGVADVRLRINFFDQLSAKAEQQTATSLADNVAAVRDQTVAAFKQTVSTLGLDEEHAGAAQQLAEDFAAGVNSAVQSSVVDGQVDRKGLDSKLRDAFNTLTTSLRELTVPPVTEEPTSPTEIETPAEGTELTTTTQAGAPVETTQPQVDAEVATDPFASLVKVFEDAVAGLQQTLTAGLQLPELKPPQNNGGAYEKFLAIYNNLLETSQPESSETSPTVEISA